MSNITSPSMEKSRDAIKSQMRKRCHQGWNFKLRTPIKIASPPNHDSFGCSLMEIFLLTTNGSKYIHDAMIRLCGKCFTNKISSQQAKGRFFLLYPFYRIVLTQARFFLCESLTYNWILMQVHTVTLYYYFTLKIKFVWNCMHGFLQDKMQTDSLISQGLAAIKGSDTINRTSGSKIWRESGA